MKNIKSKSTKTQTQTHTTKESSENNKKIDLKEGSGLENNHQDQNTKFGTIAKRMVDKV